MEIKEAIRILHPDTTKEELFKYDKEESVKLVEEACLVACECMGKQVRKEPEDKRYFRAFNSYAGLCPVCRGGANSEFQYCGDCGQKLDWESGGE